MYHLQYLHEERQQGNYTETAHRGTPTLEAAKLLGNSMSYKWKIVRDKEGKRERDRERETKRDREGERETDRERDR